MVQTFEKDNGHYRMRAQGVKQRKQKSPDEAGLLNFKSGGGPLKYRW